MVDKKDIHFFEKELLQYADKYGRKNLPWRKRGIAPYEVWISEVMLQQTQVSRVVDYYNRFLERFPDVFILSEASWKEFLPYWQGLGYYRRGENMLKCAGALVRDFGGEFPREKKLLISLPGIGEYTASAILSFAFDENFLSFDTNLQRVFGRFFYGNKKSSVDQSFFEEQLVSSRKNLNAAIMDFANDVCVRTPKCDTCPLRKYCEYDRTNGSFEIQVSREVSRFPTKKAQVYLQLHENHKQYFSLDPDEYTYFILPEGVRSREEIKEYFQNEYGLTLSVRPPHKKLYIDKKPIMYVNAQILLGEHEFGVFQKEDINKEKFLR